MPKTAATSLYVVRDADIWCEAGRARVGDIVELDAAEARHFNAHGVLGPYIPDEVEEEDVGELDLRSPPLIAEFQHGDEVEAKTRASAKR